MSNRLNLIWNRISGCTLLNFDDRRLEGLVDKETMTTFKALTSLGDHILEKNALALLKKIQESVGSSKKLRSLIRRQMAEVDDFDLMEMPELNFLSRH